jgi:hypothetical protein
VQAQRAFSARYTNTAVNGDIAGIGNVNMNCAPFAPPPNPSAACATSRTHTGGSGDINNNNQNMVYTDVDSDGATFNSSAATLNLPAGSTVLFAGLYWSGQASPATVGRNTVRLAGPSGSYVTVTAGQFDSLIGQEAPTSPRWLPRRAMALTWSPTSPIAAITAPIPGLAGL